MTNTKSRLLALLAARLAYVLIWRNDTRSPTHYYAPFPGQASVPDFLKFYENGYTLFESDLQDLYSKKWKRRRARNMRP